MQQIRFNQCVITRICSEFSKKQSFKFSKGNQPNTIPFFFIFFLLVRISLFHFLLHFCLLLFFLFSALLARSYHSPSPLRSRKKILRVRALFLIFCSNGRRLRFFCKIRHSLKRSKFISKTVMQSTNSILVKDVIHHMPTVLLAIVFEYLQVT